MAEKCISPTIQNPLHRLALQPVQGNGSFLNFHHRDKTVSTNDADLFRCPDGLTTSTGANQFSGAAGTFLSLRIADRLLLDLLGCCTDSDSCEAFSHNLQLAVSFFNGVFQ